MNLKQMYNMLAYIWRLITNISTVFKLEALKKSAIVMELKDITQSIYKKKSISL